MRAGFLSQNQDKVNEYWLFGDLEIKIFLS
jgi:hypothetical protein